ncbi:MAG TPA: 50S ribosomal protein L11 methyltransferase, partial [Ferruginibacter sp.]|nr:50S ribosomal protein L11 methyltransferase [Ferruginibacter sp.]
MPNKRSYYQVVFEQPETEKSEMLIALLADAGYSGFEEDLVGLKAFIDGTQYDAAALENIINLVPAKYSVSIIEEENWNDQWEKSFQPIVVGDDVAIRADFHEPFPGVKHEIIITPKMSFGTG